MFRLKRDVLRGLKAVLVMVGILASILVGAGSANAANDTPYLKLTFFAKNGTFRCDGTITDGGNVYHYSGKSTTTKVISKETVEGALDNGALAPMGIVRYLVTYGKYCQIVNNSVIPDEGIVRLIDSLDSPYRFVVFAHKRFNLKKGEEIHTEGRWKQ